MGGARPDEFAGLGGPTEQRDCSEPAKGASRGGPLAPTIYRARSGVHREGRSATGTEAQTFGRAGGRDRPQGHPGDPLSGDAVEHAKHGAGGGGEGSHGAAVLASARLETAS